MSIPLPGLAWRRGELDRIGIRHKCFLWRQALRSRPAILRSRDHRDTAL